MIIVDLREHWQSHPTHRRNADGSQGIRLYAPEHSERRQRLGFVDRIVLHQWAADVGLSHQARDRIDRGESTEADELAVRASHAAYHLSVGVLSTGEGLVVCTWPEWLHTHHAGLENARSVGIGVMGLFPRVRPHGDPARDELAASLRWAIRHAAEWIAVGSGERQPSPVLLRTHSQTTAKPADPGEWAIEALAPLVPQVVRVEPEWRRGAGSPWPEAWARHVRK